MSVWKAGLVIWDGHSSQARLALSIEWFADRGLIVIVFALESV